MTNDLFWQFTFVVASILVGIFLAMVVIAFILPPLTSIYNRWEKYWENK